jgi:hypothetical protein
MKMEKTMKVTIGGKTINVSDPYRKEAIKDILIFGVGNGERTALSDPDNQKKTSKAKKVVRRERVYWTPEEVEKLKKLALRGMPVPEMTILFKKKYANINNKIRGLGIQEEHRKARAYRRDEEERVADTKFFEVGEENKQNDITDSPWKN